MQLINGKELAHMPDGTVFSNVEWNGTGDDDYKLHGLYIMMGNGNPSDNYFNGVLTMLDYVPVENGKIGCSWDPDKLEYFHLTIQDLDQNDYAANDWMVVFDRDEIQQIIDNLNLALELLKSGKSLEG